MQGCFIGALERMARAAGPGCVRAKTTSWKKASANGGAWLGVIAMWKAEMLFSKKRLTFRIAANRPAKNACFGFPARRLTPSSLLKVSRRRMITKNRTVNGIFVNQYCGA